MSNCPNEPKMLNFCDYLIYNYKKKKNCNNSKYLNQKIKIEA